jgi:DNA-binding LacI/PurR family transcriptional regulator
MTPTLPSLRVKLAGPVTQQVTDHLRSLIATGVFGPGTRLPAYRELSELVGVPPSTVNTALRPLVKEGWLHRRHGSGTFVRERPRELKTIGLYYYGGELANPEHRYLRAMHQCLLAQIGQAGRQWMMWNDPRSADAATQPWAELTNACRHGEIDALIVPVLDCAHYGWLSKLPVPVAYCVAAQRIPNRVDFDYRGLGELAVAELARQGCRTVGLVTGLPVARNETDPLSGGALDSLEGFKSEAAARGLHTRDEWIFGRPQGEAVPSCKRWGAEAFARLWEQRERPEGLVALMDIEAEGVTTAILERGIRVPDELRLVYHKSAEVDLLCPFPVSYVVGKAADMAAAVLRLVEKEYAGEKVSPVTIGWNTVTGLQGQRRMT